MSFEDFLNKAWSEHATQADQVGTRISNSINLIESNEQIVLMAQLVTHVFGEHLAQWENGILTLKQLRNLEFFEQKSEADRAIARSIASLELSAGKDIVLQDFSVSDQIRILTVSASALSAQADSKKACHFFREALVKAQTGISKDDPANRALAVAGNNLASSLEEKSDRTEQDTELMILAAKTGRQYWEIAGTWKQVFWAEYRLAMTYIKASDLISAFEHAQTCLELSRVHDTSALEQFYGFEALAWVEKSRTNMVSFVQALEQAEQYFQKLNATDQEWCKTSLQKLRDVKA